MNRCFSKALYKENLKRFWSLSALAFVVYYFSSIYILQLREGKSYNYYTINEMLLNQNIGFVFVECMLPVFISAALFAGLNKANSVNFMHSLPLTRREIFITNYASGITLYLIPQVIIAIFLFIYRKPVYYSDYDGKIDGYDIFTAPAILHWLFVAFTVSLFVFSVCLVASAICGNTVISALTGMGLNVVVPLVYLCIHCYAYNSYFGYANDNIVGDVLEKFHPAITLLYEATILKILIWVAVSLIVAVCAYLLYEYRKLERSSDAYVYQVAKDIFGFLFVFICATITNEMFDGEPKYLSIIIGAVIGFLIGQMITRKTFKIFDLKGLKNLVIYAVIMALLICGISLDITGYQKRVPDERNVESVNVISSELYPLNSSSYGTALFQEEDNIKTVIALHQEIVDHMDELKNEEGDYYHSSFCVTYYLTNGKRMEREYLIDQTFLEKSQNFYNLRNSDELLNGRNAIAELNLNDLELEMYVYKYDSMPDGLGEYEIYFNNDDPVVLLSSDEFPAEGQTWANFLAKKGYKISVNKEEFWDAFCEDLLSKDLRMDFNQYQVGSIMISFDKSGFTETEASKFANKFYSGASYYCKSEATSTYTFTLHLDFTSSMIHTLNWLNNSIK